MGTLLKLLRTRLVLHCVCNCSFTYAHAANQWLKSMKYTRTEHRVPLCPYDCDGTSWLLCTASRSQGVIDIKVGLTHRHWCFFCC